MFPTFLDADRCQWDWNPKMTNSAYSSALSKAGQGQFYQWPNELTVTRDFNGCVKLMKNYVVTRSSVLDSLASDSSIPSQSSLAYLGPDGYRLNRLTFRCSSYQGTYPFAAMKWRVGEITLSDAPALRADEHPYEITPVWESAELPVFTSDMSLPPSQLQVGHAYRARVRLKDSTGRWSRWSAPVQFVSGDPDTAAALVANLKVTELMYNPLAGSEFEFIELHNASDSLTLDLEGAQITSGVDFSFPSGTTMNPGSYLLVINTTNQPAFRAHYRLAESVPLVGPYSGNLANSGEQLALKVAADGLEIATFDFAKGRGWPVAAQGAGHSLVPLDHALQGQTTGALDYPGNWRASAYIGGSPGGADPPAPAPTVIINEFAAHTDHFDPARPEYDSNDWIELYNTTATNITLNGWFLSDDPANPGKWAIPSLSIPGRGWITFDEVSGFHTPITNGFGINKAGEQLLLSYLPGTTEDRLADAIAFKGQENERSLSRYPDGDAWWFTTLRTSNTLNSAGLSSLVISEVMYHPPDLGTNDNTRDEFIELYNPTSLPITLQDTNGTWHLSGGIAFDFPTNTILPAGGVLLVVNINPADSAALATFRTVYGITNFTIPILGPYNGKLGNRSNRVALEKPQFPDPPGDPYSWVIADEVIYGNQEPWPTNANGGGLSLNRLTLTKSGNDSSNWGAALPTPGVTSSAPLDRDGDGMPDAWEIQYGFNPTDPRDAALDADGEGQSNLAEFLSGTDPRNTSSVLKFDLVTESAGIVSLQFTALTNRSYTIQYLPDVGGRIWSKLADVAPGTTRTVTVPVVDSTAYEHRYYRLVTPALP